MKFMSFMRLRKPVMLVLGHGLGLGTQVLVNNTGWFRCMRAHFVLVRREPLRDGGEGGEERLSPSPVLWLHRLHLNLIILFTSNVSSAVIRCRQLAHQCIIKLNVFVILSVIDNFTNAVVTCEIKLF